MEASPTTRPIAKQNTLTLTSYESSNQTALEELAENLNQVRARYARLAARRRQEAQIIQSNHDVAEAQLTTDADREFNNLKNEYDQLNIAYGRQSKASEIAAASSQLERNVIAIGYIRDEANRLNQMIDDLTENKLATKARRKFGAYMTRGNRLTVLTKNVVVGVVGGAIATGMTGVSKLGTATAAYISGYAGAERSRMGEVDLDQEAVLSDEAVDTDDTSSVMQVAQKYATNDLERNIRLHQAEKGAAIKRGLSRAALGLAGGATFDYMFGTDSAAAIGQPDAELVTGLSMDGYTLGDSDTTSVGGDLEMDLDDQSSDDKLRMDIIPEMPEKLTMDLSGIDTTGNTGNLDLAVATGADTGELGVEVGTTEVDSKLEMDPDSYDASSPADVDVENDEPAVAAPAPDEAGIYLVNQDQMFHGVTPGVGEVSADGQFEIPTYVVPEGQGWYDAFSNLGVDSEYSPELLNSIGDQLVDMGVATPHDGSYWIAAPGELPTEATELIINTAHENGWLASSLELEVAPDLPTVDAGEGLNQFVQDNYDYELSAEESLELGAELEEQGFMYNDPDYLGERFGNPYGINAPGEIDLQAHETISDMVDDGELNGSADATVETDAVTTEVPAGEIKLDAFDKQMFSNVINNGDLSLLNTIADKHPELNLDQLAAELNQAGLEFSNGEPMTRVDAGLGNTYSFVAMPEGAHIPTEAIDVINRHLDSVGVAYQFNGISADALNNAA